MSARLILVALVCVFALPLASAVANDELPQTPKAFEERVDVLLGVEQDADAVLVLAKRVMQVHGAKEPWAAALVNAGVRAGEAGHRVVAVNVLQLVTGEKGKVLEEPDQARVRAAMRRWGQGGDSASPFTPEYEGIRLASPLEQKVRELFAPLAPVTDRKEASRVRSRITAALVDAGPEILGVLARIASDTPGAVGLLAGELLAKRGGEDAKPYLERMMTSGSPLTRGTAVRSLSDLPYPETGSWWEAHGDFVERLTKGATATEQRYIRSYVHLNKMNNNELWARFQQGGEYAHEYLRRLGRNQDVRAYREAIASLTDKTLSEADRQARRNILLGASQNQRGRIVGPLLADLDEKTMRAVVDVFLESGYSGFNSQHSVLWVLGRWNGDDEARNSIADDVWMTALRKASQPDTKSNEISRICSMLRSLSGAKYMPPKGICEDEALCETLFAYLNQILMRAHIGPLFAEQPKLFERMFEVMPKLEAGTRKGLLGHVLQAELRPSKRWSEVLALPPFQEPSGKDGLLPSIINEVARAKDPALWPWIRTHVEEAGYPEHMRSVVSALGRHPDAEVLAFAKRALDHAKGMDQNVLNHIMLLLDYRYLDVEEDTAYGAGALATLETLAGDPAHPASVLAVQKLINLQQDDKLVPLFAQALDMPRPLPESWRGKLVAAADTRLLVEAAPFLIEQYRERREDHVAKVLDKLRAHRERLASFENWRAEEGRDAVNALLAQLDSEDASERRIAVVALAAMREQRAIPKLAKLALQDPDATVRGKASAALEALAGLPK